MLKQDYDLAINNCLHVIKNISKHEYPFSSVSLDFTKVLSLYNESFLEQFVNDLFQTRLDNNYYKDDRGADTLRLPIDFSIEEFPHVTDRGCDLGGNRSFPDHRVGLLNVDMYDFLSPDALILAPDKRCLEDKKRIKLEDKLSENVISNKFDEGVV